jgi:hypothetical protein
VGSQEIGLSIFFLGLGFMAFGRHGQSIEEVDNYNVCRCVEGLNRKAFKKVGWQIKYGGKLRERW